jgi:hypothetical protein
MRNLWAKIGLGAVGVFAVGMMLITVGQQAKAATKEVLATAAQHAASWTGELAARAEMDFLLNGEAIGRVQQVEIRRAATGDLPQVRAVVRLTAPGAERALEGCILEPEGGTDMDVERGFRCAASGTDLVDLGEIVFEPAGFTRPVRVTRTAETELRQGDPFAVQAEVGGRVQVEATGDNAELVRILAGQHGANIKVNDEFGRNLVRLLADSTGAMLRVRDENGRDVIHMQAGKHGFRLTVDTAAGQ